jgi:hypothetical protein
MLDLRESSMMRKIAAVFVGFVVWSVLWLALNAGLRAAHLLPPPDQALTSLGVLLTLLAGSVLASLAAGLSASWLAREPGHKAVIWLGAVLLAVGAMVQAQYWQLMPVWYHVSFLLLLIPACLAGSRLGPNGSSRPTPLHDAA